MIDLAQARDLLARAVETQGRDFIYSTGGGCFYVPLTEENINTMPTPIAARLAFYVESKRKTGCLIGVALDLAGETRHHFRTSIIHSVYNEYPNMMSYEAKEYFSVAQSNQDYGSTWGTAYDRAEASIQADQNED